MLIQSGLGNPPLAPGGFAMELPKDQISQTAPMAWAYQCLESTPSYFLTGQDGFTSLLMRINCHGLTAANAQQLAYAVDKVLRGEWSGTLSDPDATVVQGIFRENAFVDGYSDANRAYVRTLEYLINYQQQ